MLIRTLKKYQPINLVIYLIICILAWIVPLTDSHTAGIYYDSNPMPLYSIIFYLLSAPKLAFVCKILAFLTVTLQGLVINGILNQYNLLGIRGYLPGIIFVLLSSTFSEYQILHPILLSNFFLIFAWERIVRLHEKENTFEAYFNASFLIGLASLFYPNSVYFLIIAFLSVGMNRVGHPREYAMIIAGFATVWYFYLTINYLTASKLNLAGLEPDFSFAFTRFPKLTLSQLIILILTGLLLVISSVQVGNFMSNSKIPMRRNVKFLFLWFWIGILIFLVTKSSAEIVYVIAIPVSVLFTVFFVNFKKGILIEVIWGIFILAIALNISFPGLLKF